MKKLGSIIAVAMMVCGAQAAEPGKPALGSWGVDLTSRDQNVKPGDDFFNYVNGTWLKTAEIDPARSSTGAFLDLQMLSEVRMKAIIADLAAKPYDSLNNEERKLRDLFDAFVDRDQIEKNGLKPVEKDLRYLAGLKSLNDVAVAMGSVRLATTSIFNGGITPDDKNPDAYAIMLVQSGLGMPDRDYYLRTDAEIKKTQAAYKQYLADMLAMAGMSDAKARADDIYAVEEKIAAAQWPNEDRRQSDKMYNPMLVKELKAFAPDFPWDAYFKSMGVPMKDGQRWVIVGEKSAFPKLANIFAATPVAVWRDYLTVHYLHSFSSYLPLKFEDRVFAFYGTELSGRTKQLDRATRGVRLLDSLLGEALGKLYVAKYFPPDSKAKMEKLVDNLLKAYEADLQTLDWMSPATRDKALEKIKLFTPMIGYPDKWRDYSAFKISRADLISSVQNGAVYEWDRELRRLDKKVDRTEWGMSPPTVNAYYSTSFNNIVFPAAILQPPFFDPNADDAVNYGGIGAVIGHEISHGFDDQGSKYDGHGAMTDWWTPEDRKNFDARTAALAAQYDAYEPLPGLKVNGKFTLGENIADLAGISIALKAYHISLGGKPAPVIDGLTGDQRFFLAYGQVWRSKYRDNALRQNLLSDPHSPGMFRVIGATRNVDSWYDAFGVKKGDKYYLSPKERVRLW